MGDKLLGDTRQFIIRDRLWDAGEAATLSETGEVIDKAEELVIEGAAEIGRRGGEDESGIVRRDGEFRLGKNSTIEVRKGLSHAGSVRRRRVEDNSG
jgi:hypothetical protein